MRRSSGALLPISALPGEYMIGSFGKAAYDFIGFLKECGFSWWQVLPLGTVDFANSPYASCSAFGGNPYYIDLDILFEKGLISDAERRTQRQSTPYSCEYETLKDRRMQLLLTASGRVTDRSKIEKFISESPHLESFCMYMALKHATGGKMWSDFDKSGIDDNIFFMWEFIQYEFFEEWSALKKYAGERGIKIMGDMPMYVSLDSSDVWANRQLFLLSEDGSPRCVAGVPPDYFSKTGQMWGNPLYDWDKMKENGYRWWRDRIRHNLVMFDAVRIDHFRGFESYYSIPADAAFATEGEWKKGPGSEFIDYIRSSAGDGLIVAEDLGEITDEVRELLDYSGFPGMRVLQFGFLSDGDSPHMPHNYIRNCIAYSGTHDNNTLLGYLYELGDDEHRRLKEYCGLGEQEDYRLFDAVLRLIFASSAGIVILPVQDILGFGADTRMNIPGKAEGNWRFRVTADQLARADKEKFKRLNRIYKRTV